MIKPRICRARHTIDSIVYWAVVFNNKAYFIRSFSGCCSMAKDIWKTQSGAGWFANPCYPDNITIL